MKKSINIVECGAVADGDTLCILQIQRAIDLCPKGGEVLIPTGVFRSGALFLKSNMTLRLEEGATLLGRNNSAPVASMVCAFSVL